MKTQTLRYCILLVFFIPVASCLSQNAKSKTIEEDFKKFDGNESGWLSGNELVACNCKNYDSNGDNEVTKEEFFAGNSIKMQSNTITLADADQIKSKAEEVETDKAPNNGTTSANVKGAWWYTTILYADGTVYELRNRQSSLDLHGNGTYNQNIWVGAALQGRAGKYIMAGNRLTLTPGGGKKEIFNVSFSPDGKLLTLKANDGSGWKLESPKK